MASCTTIYDQVCKNRAYLHINMSENPQMIISGFIKVGIKSLLLADEGDTIDVPICSTQIKDNKEMGSNSRRT